MMEKKKNKGKQVVGTNYNAKNDKNIFFFSLNF